MISHLLFHPLARFFPPIQEQHQPLVRRMGSAGADRPPQKTFDFGVANL